MKINITRIFYANDAEDGSTNPRDKMTEEKTSHSTLEEGIEGSDIEGGETKIGQDVSVDIILKIPALTW